MKKILALCALAGSICLTAFAQAPDHGKDGQPNPNAEKHLRQIESEKIAFITRQMDITPEEAGPFWALYNKLEKEQKALVKAEMEAFKTLNKALREEKKEGVTPKTDAEIEGMLSKYLSAKKANTDIHAKHSSDYKKIVGAKKTALFYAAQERFRRQQINRLRHHEKPGQKPAGGHAQ